MEVYCHTCGKKASFSCGVAPCGELKGWLTLEQWQGVGIVSNYHFCSMGCLKTWVDSQMPHIPAVFLQSFEEDG